MSLENSSLQLITVCQSQSEIHFSEESHRIETSQLIYEANRLTGFCVVRVFTERYFRTDVNAYPFTHVYYLNQNTPKYR